MNARRIGQSLAGLLILAGAALPGSAQAVDRATTARARAAEQRARAVAGHRHAVEAARAQAAAGASTASIRECGDWGWNDQGQGPMWAYHGISGAGLYNLTTR